MIGHQSRHEDILAYHPQYPLLPIFTTSSNDKQVQDMYLNGLIIGVRRDHAS